MKFISSLAMAGLLCAMSLGQGMDPLGSVRQTTFTVSTLPEDLIALDVMTSKDNLMSLMQLSMGGGTITGPDTGRPSIDPQMILQMMNVIWTTKQDFASSSEFMIGYKLDAAFTPRGTAVSASSLRFRLTYVRRQSIISLTPREDFAPATLRELAKEPSPQVASAADRTITISNLKQVATGTMILLADNDDNFPYVQSTPQLFKFVEPYTKNLELFKTHNPMGGEFRFNMSLAGSSATAVESPAETPMYFESEAWPDGKRCVAFVDTHVKAVSAEEWAKMQPLLKLKLGKSGKPLKPGDPLPDTSIPTPPPAKKKKGGG